MKIMSRVLLALFCLGLAANAADQTTIVLKAARMFDGKSKAVVQNAVGIVQGDKIVDVGSYLSVPDGAPVLDLGDATLRPGFVDARPRLTLDFSGDYK